MGMYEYEDAWIMTAQLNEKKNGCELCMRPLVLCKDCEHCYFASNRVPDERSYACEKHGIDIVPDWFCADGERKVTV